MGYLLLESDSLQLEAEIDAGDGYDVVGIVEDADEADPGDPFHLELVTDTLSFDADVGVAVARSVAEHLLREAARSDGHTAVGAFVASLTDSQLAFVGTLAEHDERIASTPLRERMAERLGEPVSPRSLGGTVRGVHSKAEEYVGERVEAANWLDDAAEYEYWLKDEYRPALRAALDDGG